MPKRIQHIFNKTWSNKSAKGSKLFWISLIVTSFNSKVSFIMKFYPLVKREQNWHIRKLKYYYINFLTDVVCTQLKTIPTLTFFHLKSLKSLQANFNGSKLQKTFIVWYIYIIKLGFCLSVCLSRLECSNITSPPVLKLLNS